MTFGSTFGRTFSPTFQPKSQAAVAGGTWWDLNGTITSCVAAYQAKGAASQAASYANLANTGTYDLTEAQGTPDWSSANGYEGDGNSILASSIQPNPTGSAWSFIIRVSNMSYATNNAIFGAYTSTSNRFGLICLTTGLRAENGNISYIDTNKPTSGVFCLSNAKYYVDGSYVTDASGSTPYNNQSIFLMARKAATYLPTTAYIQALAIYNAYITADEIASLSTAMAAL